MKTTEPRKRPGVSRRGGPPVLAFLLYLVAVVLLTLAAFGVRTGRVSLGWLGLAVAVFTYGVLPELT